MDPFDDPPPNSKLNKPSAEGTLSGNCKVVPRPPNTCENLESDYACNIQPDSGNCPTETQLNHISYLTRNEHDNQKRFNDNSVLNCRNVNPGDSNYDEQIVVASSSKLVLATEVESNNACLGDSSNNHNISIPSTSHASESIAENIASKENRKRPSSLKLNQQNLGIEDNSSDTGNDDYSLGSEDGCIYTYRGGEHLADLPSSFFSLDMGLPLDKHLPMPANYPLPQQLAPNARDQGSRTSSPDMDFLEMDFDPGPSCDADTSDESSPDGDLEVGIDLPDENEPVFVRNTPECQIGVRLNVQTYNNSAPAVVASQGSEIQYSSVPSTSRGLGAGGQGDNLYETKTIETYGPYITHVSASGQKILVRRTMSHWPSHSTVSLHVSSGDLVSPREILQCEDEHPESPFAYQINQGENAANMSSALYHLNMAKKLMVEKTKSEEGNSSMNMAGDVISKTESEGGEITVCADPPRTMVWSEQEACERQVTQIATSACGATAVVNVFTVLGVPVNIERINAAVGTRQRANNAPLPRYLLSRSVAGCTAEDLVNGIQRASEGLVAARFFPTYPERAMSLSHWLADWISEGAVPILTLNLQVGCEGEIPDAWHHQMVFGVSSRGIYLCNPVECVPESTLWPRLTSPSILLVRTRDALVRFTTSTDLTPLMVVPDRRFHTFNVLGQVANAIREWRTTGWSEHGTRTRHIRIPASYQAGITVAALTGSEAHRRLMHAASLPLLAPHSDATNR